ncbi:MAG: SAM-dependent chlorinase/fluorinase, partial [Deltaproteobacteria bacterium]
MDTLSGDTSKNRISVISLTTDFGLSDEYVGVMKAVMLRHAPLPPIVDLCHHIGPQNILQAAFLLSDSFRYFPDSTLHVVVVDPGVGTDRKILLVKACGHFFLAPDNGVLSFLPLQDISTAIRQVTNRDLFLCPLSNTFHGRDIFAPVAGALGAGMSPAAVGPQITGDTVRRIALPAPELAAAGKSLTGVVIGVDHFGNLRTNIHHRDLASLASEPDNIQVRIGGASIVGLSASYGDHRPGSLVALIGSRGYLEIALSNGNAGRHLGVNAGQSVTVE